MPLHPVKDISEYKRVKDALKDRFENERTGDQDLFREQTKIFQPLINTQQQTAKAIKDTQDVNSRAFSNALVPLVRELEKRNDQVDSLMEQPFYSQEIPAIGPVSPEIMKVDLDADLNVTDRENLEIMEFDLPSVVFKNKTVEDVLEKIKKENRSIGQNIGKASKLDTKQKQMYESQKLTLETYRRILQRMQGAKQFISTPKKVGKGLKTPGDVIYYSSAEDLCAKLAQLYAAKQAGNTGLDNTINSILDELLKVKAIDKN